MRQQFTVLHKMLLEMVRGDLVCRRLMTAPGVGAVVALTYRATVDQPQRFVHSRAVGAHVGLTPKRYQSGGSTTTAGCPSVATPCYAQCSTKPHTHCSPAAGNGRG
jgi:transposase